MDLLIILWPYLNFLIFCYYFFITVFIITRNPRRLINWLAASVVCCYGIWSFGVLFIENVKVGKETAQLSQNISSFGWTFFSVFYLNFALAYTGRKKLLKNPLFQLLIFGLAAFFHYLQWTGRLINDFSLEWNGWATIWAENAWPKIFYLFYSVNLIAVVILSLFYARRQIDSQRKKQAKIIAFSTLGAYLLGSISSTIIPLLGIHGIPRLGHFFAGLYTVGLAYIMAKYDFLKLTPALAAKNILASMNEGVIITDGQGNILRVNKSILEKTGERESFFLKKNFFEIIKFGDKAFNLYEEIRKKEKIHNIRGAMTVKNKKSFELFLSFSAVKDKSVGLAGLVVVAKDISKESEIQKKLQEKIEETQRINDRLLDREMEIIKLKNMLEE